MGRVSQVELQTLNWAHALDSSLGAEAYEGNLQSEPTGYTRNTGCVCL